MKRCILLILTAFLFMLTASCGISEMSNVNRPTDQNGEIDPAVYMYFNYYKLHWEMQAFFYDNKVLINDTTLTAFALIHMETEKEEGYTKDELNAAAMKYFGRKIKNFNNELSHVNPESGLVQAGGFGYEKSLYLILKNMKENESGLKTADFYAVLTDDMELDESLSNYDIEKDLLAGNVTPYLDYSSVYLVRMKFQEITENNETYFKYHSIKVIKKNVKKIEVYKG